MAAKSSRLPAGSLTNDDIIELKRASFSDLLILARIDAATVTQFDVDTNSLVQLKASGLSDEVIAAMVKKSH